MSLPTIYTAALIAALLFACAKGSRDAQLVATGYLAAQLTAMAISRAEWDHPQLGLFAVDLLLLGWLLWIVLRASATWPIAAGVLQVLTVLGHCARLSVPAMDRLGYFVLLQWTAWPAFATIVVGTMIDARAGRTSPVSWRAAGWRMRRRPPEG